MPIGINRAIGLEKPGCGHWYGEGDVWMEHSTDNDAARAAVDPFDEIKFG